MRLFGNAGKPGCDHILGLPIAYEVSAGAVVFRRREGGAMEFLLLRYPHGHWDFAKGHVEAGETLEEAAEREIQEETGLGQLRLISGFHRRTFFWYRAKGTERDRRLHEGRALFILKTVHFFLVEASSSPVTLSHEHMDFVWLSLDAAIERATFENAKQLLRKAGEQLRQSFS